MSQTYSTTQTSTYTEARSRVVMVSILEDLIVLAASRLIDHEKAKKWMDDLLYLLNARVLNYFELQVYVPNGSRVGAYRYVLKDDGSLQEDSKSGGIDPYGLPVGARVGLFADIDYSKSNIVEVNQYLVSRGWGTNGTPIAGQASYERTYSKEGYGFQRYKVGL
jgi:hypothetical protein